MSRRMQRLLLFFSPWAITILVLYLTAIFGPQTGMFRDAKIYMRALEATRAGHNPYVAGLALQQSAQAQGDAEKTFAFVYPPYSLLLIRAMASLPGLLPTCLYWTLYACGALAQLWAVLYVLSPDEQRIARYLLPFCLLFPAFIYSKESIFGGNIAYILYGILLPAALLGCRKGNWKWFYLAVLLAACIKPQMLTLLILPLLVGAPQWQATILTGIGSVSLVGLQRFVWPEVYQSWQTALNLQFLRYDREFGVGVVSILGCDLWRRHLPYQLPCMILYGLLAGAILTALLVIARYHREEKISTTDLLPVMLTGVIQLNPRILGNDFFCLTIPLAAILLRFLRQKTGSWKWTVLCSLAIMFVLNILAIVVAPLPRILAPNGSYYSVTIGAILGIFALGCWQLCQQARSAVQPAPPQIPK